MHNTRTPHIETPQADADSHAPGDAPIVALLLAGGSGCRIPSSRPKQFIEIAGRPVIAYPMLTLQRHPDIKALYAVCAPEWQDFVVETARREEIGKFAGCVDAGASGLGSILNGIRRIRRDYPAADPIVVIHESARPLLSDAVLSANLDTARRLGNAVTAIRSNEAYMVSDDGLRSSSHIPRERLHRAQTPQTFLLSDIERTFARAADMGISDSQSLYTLMAETGCPECLHIAPGLPLNFKLTIPEDVDILRALIAGGILESLTLH